MMIWKKIRQLLESNQTLYLLTVVESIGSAPGRCGFQMFVSDNGELYGSIGGGIMEYNMVEQAKLLLSQGKVRHYTIEQTHRGDAKSSSGMICSGSQVIAFNHLAGDDLILVQAIEKKPQILEFSAKGLEVIPTGTAQEFRQKSTDVWSYRQLINNLKPKVHLFGAGHVSVPTSQLLTQIGFDVHLYDNRENINTFEQNHRIKEKKCIEYSNILSQISIDNSDYVLLMTHKFTEDKSLLSQLLGLDLKYLGVLGSKNKIATMFDSLEKQGYKKAQLHRVYAPIGLNINSQTTAEIAVSIVAEMVKVKNS